MIDKHTIKKIEGEAKAAIAKIENKKPVVEKINKNEIYLLDDKNNRLKRICGFEDKDGWPCINEAGHSTLHEGVGKCNTHENYMVGNKDYLKRLGNIISDDSELKKHIEGFSDTKLQFSTQDLQNLLGVFLTHFIEMNQFTMTNKKQELLIFYLRELRQVLETQSKIEKNKAETTAIIWFVKTVLEIIYTHAPDKFNIIKEKISTVPLPDSIQDIEFDEVK